MLPLVDSRSVHKTKMGSESNHVRWFPLARAGEAGSGGRGRCENVYVWHVGDYPKSDALVDRKSTSTDARQAGWIGRSAKTVMCPRAARVHRTSSQAPRSYHSNRDTRSITSRALGLGAGRADARLDDRFDDRQFTSSPVPLATLCALCVPLRRRAPVRRAAAPRRCNTVLRGAPRGAARRLGAPRRCAALGRSVPLHPSLLDEHRCAT